MDPVLLPLIERVVIDIRIIQFIYGDGLYPEKCGRLGLWGAQLYGITRWLIVSKVNGGSI